ncbi:NAD(P)/FAD-dependent oxidoreductase [Streptomyces purpurogeneiscleroticus]|uniref:NAD(P)/FAD-dependent oxidoreductase n=1 Tax=Streptomyces purpurogeneiscleroticus TaxID=68259 RepID=UPI001CBD5EBC|nr:tryptophan 7-halogenase [Streptomyces purpurogeneiscleroticus]MBZ4016050.1 FAD-dependent oxidoreductase [Streptomyces purpurogeneiscleroticus]
MEKEKETAAPTLLREPDNDVIILGAGIAGSILGAILARAGARVLIVDAGAHPRFAVGESMIPYTLLGLRMLAERYGVPEIATLSSYKDCTKEISSSFGQKRNFGFIRHTEGSEPNPREANQFNTPGIINRSGHLFRQDTDAYLFNTAIRYGCMPKLAYRVTDVDIHDDGVAVMGADGTTLRARYLVDASGFRSPLAQKLDLREDPCRFKHHSRSIFTHMIGVRTPDAALRHPRRESPPVPWHSGTMHHLFDRGWFWVIPFNNHKGSKNPLVSVGLTMDPRTYPKSDAAPEEEFREFASRYPAIKRQFEGATAVRPWVSTDRLQYSSRRSVGARWCLMSHAAGFLDPLFSRGLSNTVEVINVLAWRLLDALRRDHFTDEHFAYVQTLEQGLLDYNDGLVNSSFLAFDSYDLWNAVFRIWAFGSVVGGFRLQRALSAHRRTHQDGIFRALEEVPNVGLWWPDHAEYKKLFDSMVTQCEAFEQGQISASDAAAELFRQLAEADYIPKGIGFADPDTRFLFPTPAKLARMCYWLAAEAPTDMREMIGGVAVEMARTGLRGRRLF